MVMLTIPIYALIPALVLTFGLGLAMGIARAGELRIVAPEKAEASTAQQATAPSDQEGSTDEPSQ